MYTIITVYKELFAEKVVVKRETTCDWGTAREAFNIYIMDPECTACMVLDGTEGNKYILRYDRECFE